MLESACSRVMSGKEKDEFLLTDVPALLAPHIDRCKECIAEDAKGEIEIVFRDLQVARAETIIRLWKKLHELKQMSWRTLQNHREK
jgi:hypothetical protein